MFAYESREEFRDKFISSESYVDPGRREQMLAQIKKDGEINNFEAKVLRKDNSIIWIRFSGRIYPEKGFIEGMVIEITEEKRAQDELEHHRDHLEDLVRERTAELQQEIDVRKKTSEELSREKLLSETLINSLPGIFYVIGEDGRQISQE